MTQGTLTRGGGERASGPCPGCSAARQTKCADEDHDPGDQESDRRGRRGDECRDGDGTADEQQFLGDRVETERLLPLVTGVGDPSPDDAHRSAERRCRRTDDHGERHEGHERCVDGRRDREPRKAECLRDAQQAQHETLAPPVHRSCPPGRGDHVRQSEHRGGHTGGGEGAGTGSDGQDRSEAGHRER